jgi:hypothetical protein
MRTDGFGSDEITQFLLPNRENYRGGGETVDCFAVVHLPLRIMLPYREIFQVKIQFG